jgi:EpsI family protein
MPKGVHLIFEGFLIPAVAILALQSAAPRFISLGEREFPLPSLNRMPSEVGQWQARGDEELDRGVTEYLRPDEYVLRDYVDPTAGTVVNFFVAYFKTMQNSWGPHSPSVCLPGSGWLVKSYRTLQVEAARAKTIPVNEYVLEKSGQHILVFYWYQNGRSVWTDELDSKQRQLLDLVQHHRSDICLVRLVVPMRGEAADPERAHLLEFTQAVFPSLADRLATSD